MKKLSFSLLAALCLLCSCAGPKSQAQNPDQQTPAQTKRQNIIKLLDLMEIKSNLSGYVNTMLEYTLKMGHGVPPKFFEYIKAEFKYDKFIEMYIAVYDKNFSDEDIKELIKFYESPLGKKLLQTARLKNEDSYRILEEMEAEEKTVSPDSQIQPKRQDMLKLFNLTIEPLLSAMPDSEEEYETSLMDKIAKAYIAIYDKIFSDEDIKELIKFYESPVGKKELQIILESSHIVQELGKELYSFLYANVGKASNFTFDDDDDEDDDDEIVFETFTDARDNQTYKVLKIGEQTWMAVNLNYAAKNSKCYENNDSYCQKYGRLYNWEEATKACPAGWHLPANADWDKLGTGSKIEKIATPKFINSLSGGFSNGRFNFADKNGYHWSATKGEASNANYFFSTAGGQGLFVGSQANLFSVRCIRD